MEIRTYGTTTAATPTRNEIVAVMNELTTIRRKRTGDTEYLAPYAAAKEFATRSAQGDVEIRIAKRAGQLDRIARAKARL